MFLVVSIKERSAILICSGARAHTSRGFRPVRFPIQELDENIGAVVDAIGRAIDELELVRNPPSPALPVKGREPNQGWCSAEGEPD
ncbi:MAG TPA: hypothetical protein VHE81_20960 [Lacipirellulaceae bacterium]|nr:hypothetical protein [Lacipirellulaceae bacterium]